MRLMAIKETTSASFRYVAKFAATIEFGLILVLIALCCYHSFFIPDEPIGFDADHFSFSENKLIFLGGLFESSIFFSYSFLSFHSRNFILFFFVLFQDLNQLKQIMCSHKSVLCRNETSFLGTFIDEANNYDKLQVPAAAGRSYVGELSRKAFINFVKSILFQRDKDQTICTGQKNYADLIDFIMYLFPTSKFVLIVPAKPSKSANQESLKLTSEDFLRLGFMVSNCEEKYRANCMVVESSSLKTNGAEHLKKIAEFVGLAWDASMLSALERLVDV